MYSLFHFIILLFSLFPGFVQAGNTMAAEELYLYAVDLQKSGDYQRAATEFGRYLSYSRRHPEETYPDHQEAMHRYAQSLEKSGEHNRALKAYADLGRFYPTSEKIPQAIFELGTIHENQNHIDSAKLRYGQLRQFVPGTAWDARATLRQAWQHLQLGEDQKANLKLQEIDHPDYLLHANKALDALPELGELPQKDPKTAAILSAILPGAGHAYVGRPKDARFAFLSNGLMIGATVEAFNRDMPALGAVLGVLELGWYSGTIFSASSLAHKYNKQQRDQFLDKIQLYFDVDQIGIKADF